MAGKAKAIVIDPKDNVATALVTLEAGAIVVVEVCGRAEKVKLASHVPAGHKFALREMEKGTAVIKYGEPIGQSRKRIVRGEHVHVHNVVSRPRGGL